MQLMASRWVATLSDPPLASEVLPQFGVVLAHRPTQNRRCFDYVTVAVKHDAGDEVRR